MYFPSCTPLVLILKAEGIPVYRQSKEIGKDFKSYFYMEIKENFILCFFSSLDNLSFENLVTLDKCYRMYDTYIAYYSSAVIDLYP